MQTTTGVQKGVRNALLSGAVASLSCVSFGVAAAQNSGQANDPSAGSQALGTVTVTGSRIKRSSAATAQPVLRISHQDIEISGIKNLGQLLHTMTASGAGLNTTYNAGFNRHGTKGASQVDLRHLGAERALVLINGRRFNTGLGGGVNLNLIPLSIVDHIEVLQDGASAVYGSDAIAGVINVITRKDFQGAQASAYYGQFLEHHDGTVQNYNFAIGASTNNSGVFFNASFTQQDPVWAGDRDFAAEPLHLTGVTRGSSNTPQGRFQFYVPASFTVDPSSPGNAANPGAFPSYISSDAVAYLNKVCPTQQTAPSSYLPHCDLTIKTGTSGQQITDYRPFKPEDHYNFSPLNYALDPYQQTSLYVQGHYDFTSNLSFHSSVLRTEYESKQLLAPQTMGLSGTFSNVIIPTRPTNPYNPFGFPFNASGGPETNVISYGRRMLEAGPRIFTEDRHNWRFDGGLNGNFLTGSTLWNWNADYIFARTTTYTQFRGSYNDDRFDNGLKGCVTTGDQACVPFNIFGGQGPDGEGSMTPAMIDYIKTTQQTHIVANQRIYTANISTSNLVSLPAGGLGFAAGYQYREQDGRYQPDAQVIHSNPPVPPTDGRFNVSAYYAELQVPLIANVPGAYNLSMDVAARRDDYSTFGTSTTERAGLKWQPVEDLLIRGTWSTGFRAPSIRDLYAGRFGQGIAVDDPCSNWSSSSNAELKQRCQAAGVPKSYVQQQFQIGIQSGGNPNLDPETSISRTVGFVYSPSQVEGLDLSLDYYKIEIEDAIGGLGGQTILDFCYKTGVYCDRIQRAPVSHGIAQVVNTPVNSGGILTEGLEGSIGYRFPATDFGLFKFSVNANHIKEFVKSQPTPTGVRKIDVVDADSALSGGEFASFPDLKANLRLNWTYGDWTAAVTGHVISHFTEKCSDYLDGTLLSLTNMGLCSYPNYDDNSESRNNVGSTTWWDVQVGYNFTGLNTQLTVGVRNVFDRPPPRAVTVVRNSLFYNSMIYGVSLFGRFPYLRVTTRF